MEDAFQHSLQDYYSRVYLSQKHDSPDKSRVLMARIMFDILRKGIPINKVLDIGSGRQALEKQLYARGIEGKEILDQFEFHTCDLATLRRKQLLKGQTRNFSHYRSSGACLPFKDDCFGLVVSNLAADFMPRQVFGEIYRVLAPKGTAVFTFHHPDILPRTDGEVANLWRYLRDFQPPFANEAEIIDPLQEVGFKTPQINLRSDANDKWWEVIVEKPN
jgi:SAM-dependent methyltransferase